MNSQEKYATLGIDIGSTTVKIAILDEEHNILFSDYERHFANIRETLSGLLKKAYEQLGELQLHPMITGSGGLALSGHLNIPFTQEVVAVATALQDYAPDTDVAIELVGEDAKIIYFRGGLEQRMNGVWAGGTGSFIDQMASLMNVTVNELDALSLKHEKIYPIASRCGVFAKSDIQPILNQGGRKEDVAASIFQAVVDQTVAGLTQGRELKGTYMLLDEASVTGTANIVMAAVMAKGRTTIYNAACEPYLQQLCKMLNRMGAKISGIASNLLEIEGVEALGGTEHRLLPDMIEVGSFIGMAAMNRSELTIKDVSFENLGIIPAQFARMGIRFEQRDDDIYIPQQEHYSIDTFLDGSIMTIADAPWPGLTPDLLSIFLVVATQAKGAVLIHQKMFESRLFFVDKLIDMGAQIILCDPHRATVIGHDHRIRLRATRMTSPDIRAGVALLIAAMSAEGVSTIQNIDQIDRGYKDIDGRLNALGARITRIDDCE